MGRSAGFPVSYAVDGRQYVAVTAGAGSVLYSHWNAILGSRARGGNGTLYVFRLDGAAARASKAKAVVVPIAERPAPVTEEYLKTLPCAHFSEAQAAAGAQFYTEHRAACHGAQLEGTGGHFPSLTASGFHSRWNNNTISRLAYLVQFGMPPGSAQPIALSDATNVLAFLLSKNAVLSGNALPGTEAELNALRICLPTAK